MTSPSLPRRARIPGAHVTGRHCASTGLANLANFHGLPWTEALCFGLGGGLGLWYLALPGLRPSRLVHGRSLDFERRFFEAIGAEFRWVEGLAPQAAEDELKRAIVEGRLPLLLTDIYHLPYLDDVHFPGHVICAWAYDDDAETFLVSDMHRAELQAIPYAAMAKARVCRSPPLVHDGNFYAPSSLPKLDAAQLAPLVVAAIVENAARLLADGPNFRGIQALDSWLADLDAWPKLEDWRRCARFAYEVIERRGTGGGAFRGIYAEFLDEAAGLSAEVAALDLAPAMRALAAAWTQLAQALRELSEASDPLPGLERVRDRLRGIQAGERDYYQRALTLSSAG